MKRKFELFLELAQQYGLTQDQARCILEMFQHHESRLDKLEQQASAPSNVVHPISAKHPLVVGDFVEMPDLTTGRIARVDYDQNWTDGQRGSAYVNDRPTAWQVNTGRSVMSGALRRIGHAPTSEPTPQKPEPAPAPTRPLQVGDRVRNAAGTDTGVVAEMLDHLDGLWAGVRWRSGYSEHQVYSLGSMKHKRYPDHPTYGHVVLLDAEPDFDTQAREAGYVKAEEVAAEFESRYPRSLSPNSWAAYFVAWLHAQAKGGAK